jgi:hypothetical protein
VISGFLREVDENCTLLGYYAESSGNFVPKFQDNLSVPSSEFNKPKTFGFLNPLGFLNPEKRTDWLSQNVGKK